MSNRALNELADRVGIQTHHRKIEHDRNLLYRTIDNTIKTDHKVFKSPGIIVLPLSILKNVLAAEECGFVSIGTHAPHDMQILLIGEKR